MLGTKRKARGKWRKDHSERDSGDGQGLVSEVKVLNPPSPTRAWACADVKTAAGRPATHWAWRRDASRGLNTWTAVSADFREHWLKPSEIVDAPVNWFRELHDTPSGGFLLCWDEGGNHVTRDC